MAQSIEGALVGDIVATDFRAARVFEKFGIDFCCGGRRSVAEACREADADPEVVARALNALPALDGGREDDGVLSWPLARLVDHIVDTHHAYVRSAIPMIGHYLAKLVEVHGARHPELRSICDAFDEVGGDLMQHMMKEELVLFPYVRELASANAHLSPSPFGSIENPIRMMEREHREAGDGLQTIRALTAGFTPPDDACATYRACYSELAAFERDLHRHVHLENNVLFPRAVELEQQIARR